MKKITFEWGIIMMLLFCLHPVMGQITYSGPYSGSSATPTPLTLGAGTNTISNTFSTPPSYQRWFDLTLPAGLTITNVTFAVSGTAASGSSGTMCWNPFSSCNPSDTWGGGDQAPTAITAWSTPGTLPITSSPGVVQIIGSPGFNTTWSLVLTVTGTVACTDPTIPTVTATSPICPGASTTLNITGTLNDATAWNVYSGSCGGTFVGTTTTGTFNVTPPTGTTTYFVRGEGGCVTPAGCGSVMVTAQDTTAPVITCPADVTIECNTDDTPATTGSATAVDNCDMMPVITFSDSVVAGTGSNSVITRTWTATDANMNASMCVQTITVVDSTAPVITCPADVTIECNTDDTPATTGSATAVDNCDMMPVITFSDAVVAGTGSNSVITRTWTATDANMNASMCVQTITVVDTTAPVITCPADVTIECNTDDTPATTGSATAVDNCDMMPVITFSDAVVAGTGSNSVITRTWTATDANMNASMCVQTITVVDTTAPVITCPADVTIECNTDDTPATTGSATAVDNCDMMPVITFSDSVVAGTGSNSVITRTWTATDANMNASMCVQTITVVDTTAPVITCPADVTIECNTDDTPATTGSATAVDNCDMMPVITFSDSVVAGTGSNSVITRTWTATDANMNASMCVQTITVSDTTAPTPMCVAPFTVQLDAMGMASITAADVDNGSTDNCGMVTTSIDNMNFSCADIGTPVTVTLTVTDENMNSATCTTTVTVEDNIAPVVTCVADAPRDTDMGVCTYTIVGTEFDATFTDNCTTTTITNDLTGTDTIAGEVLPLGDTVVTWTANDGNGQTATCTTTITVEDNEAPSFMCVAPFVVMLDENGEASIDEVDVIGGILTITSVSGNNGSGASGTTDFTAPVLTDVTVAFDWSYATNDGANWDTFGYTVNGVYTQLTNSAGSTSQSGSATVALIAGDIFGFRSATVDNIAGASTTEVSNFTPGFTGQFAEANWTLALSNSDGTAFFNGTPNVTDNCGVASYSLDVYDFTCADLGDNLVTFTATDVNGNTTSCTTTVTVEDNLGVVVISGPVDIFTGTGPSDGDCETTINYGVIDINSFVIEDNCGDASTTTVVQTGGLGTGASFPVGVTAEEFTLTDNNGNETIYIFNVTITDTTAPVVDCPGDLIVSDGGTGVYTIEDYTATVTDNCSAGADLVVTQDPAAGTEVANGSTTTVTVTATDAAGNVTTCEFDILVDSTLSLEDTFFNDASISMYPNPTAGELNILAGNTTIDKVEVYDLAGRLVKRVSFETTTYQFNLNDMDAAVYLVQIFSGSNMVVKRVIKK